MGKGVEKFVRKKCIFFGKKGSSHFEMVAAFTLFILFTLFLLFYLKAPEENNFSGNILDKLEISFVNYSEIELISFLIKPKRAECIELDLPDFVIEGKSVVYNLQGSAKKDSQLSVDKLVVDANDVDVSNNELLRVYVSEGIEGESSSCSGPKKNADEIGSIKREMVLSQEKLEDFEGEYWSNYEDLKEKLGLPSNVEFAIYSEGVIDAQRDFPPNMNIFSSNQLFKIVFSNGTVSEIKVEFRAW